MTTVVVYYSLEGNCRALSEAIAGATGSVLAELKPVGYDMPKSGFMKYFKGGKGALFKDAPELEPLSTAVNEAGLVVVGGPVWFGRISPPVRSFMEKFDWTGKKAAVFAIHRGGKGRAAKDMAAIVNNGGGEALSSVNFVDLRHGNAEATLEEAIAWVETMRDKVGG